MNANASDTALLHAWQRNRDAEAFYTLVNRHAQLVFRTCRNIVRNDTDAADVAQECFLSLATTPPEIERSLAGWLHRLATHRALNHVKQQQRRREREVRYASEFPEATHKESDDLLSLLDETIDALPDDLRLPLVDHFFRQKSHQEVAEEYGIPRRTISHRINTGVEQLRAALNNRGVVAPVTGIAALLEWQRAEAASLPEGLYAKLCKYAIAGAPQKGRIHRQKVAYASAGMSGVFLVLLSLTATLVIAGWLLSYGRFLWHAAPPVAALENEELHAEVAAAPTATTENAKADDSTIERAAAAEPIAAMAGKVTGRVYDADTDAPIAGAEIKIAKDTDTYNPVSTCTTDADGHFMSDELPPGAYMIYRGKTPGYGATSEKTFDKTKKFPTHEMEGIRFRLAKDTTIDLPVRKGLVVSGVVIDKFGNGIPGVEVSGQTRVQNNRQTTKTDETGAFYLAGFSNTGDFCLTAHKQGLGRRNYTRLDLAYPGLDNLRIELTTAARVSGSVVNMDGSPVVGAKVIAVHVDSIIRWPLDYPEAQTDSQGHYTIEDLGPGQYAIYAYPKIYNQSQKADSTMVEVTGGEHVANADIKIVAVPGFRVSGIVTDVDGNPISNGLVSLGPRETETMTDTAGRFSMNVSSEGEYQPHTGVPGYHVVVPPSQQIVDINSPAGEESTMEGRIKINSDRDDLHIQLKENTFTLTGRVIASDSGEPIPYFELSTLSGHNGIPGNAEGWQGAQRVYSEDGSFRLEKMPLDPGPYTVYVVAPGHGIGKTELIIPSNATEADATVTILAHPAISGVVVDNKGQPVAGADVFTERNLLETCVATTAADGTFSATGVPLQSGMLVAFHPKYPPAASAIPQNPQDTEMRFQFQPAGEVVVHITRNGKPASMATVTVERNSFPAPAPASIGLPQKVPNCDGTVSFMGLPVGQIDVVAAAKGRWGEGLSKSQTVRISADKTTEVNIDLSGGSASIRGTFLHNGKPIYQGSVGYRVDTGDDEVDIGQAASQVDGSWKFGEVPPGIGTLRFFMQFEGGSIERLVTVELTEGENQVVDIDEGVPSDAEQYASLRGVALVDGVPSVYGSVRYEIANENTVVRYATSFESPSDEWELPVVLSGAGVLTVTSMDSEGNKYEYVQEFILAPSESKSLEINLTKESIVEDWSEP